MLEHALLYAQFGWHVFPLSPNSKIPHAGTQGFKDASTREDIIEKMWKQYPRSNIGLATGPWSEVFVLDVDVKNGKNGHLALEELKAKYGPLPDTVAQFTPSGGQQIFFKYPQGIKIKCSSNQLGDGLDIRGDGGYVVLPPSFTADGEYQWEATCNPFEYPIADMPQAYLALISTIKRDFDIDLSGKDRLLKDGRRDERMFEIACVARNQGLTEPAALFAFLQGVNINHCRPPKEEKIVMKIVESVLKYQDEVEKRPAINADEVLIWDKAKSGAFAKTYRNVLNMFKSDENLYSLFMHNEFSHQVELAKQPFWDVGWSGTRTYNDNDVLQVKQYLSSKNLEPATEHIHEAIKTISYNHRYHPVREYLNPLEWDGVERLETFFSTYLRAEDTPYTRFLGKLMFCAAVKRIYHPGCEYQYMIILEGKQGIGKTLAIKALGAPWSGRVNLLDHDRDTIDKMQMLWWIEVPELEMFKRRETESIKAFIDEPVDRARLAYAHTTEVFPRHSIFIGTINPTELGYLRDMTGNRRFLPISCGDDVDVDGIAHARDQLFAEAKELLKQGFDIYVPKQMDAMMTTEQELRLVSDAWEPTIERWLSDPIKAPTEGVTVADVWKDAFNGDPTRLGRAEQMRISSLLKKMGFVSHVIWINGQSKRAYIRKDNMPTPHPRAKFRYAKHRQDQVETEQPEQVDWT